METMPFHRTFSSYFAPPVFDLENIHFPVRPKDFRRQDDGPVASKCGATF